MATLEDYAALEALERDRLDAEVNAPFVFCIRLDGSRCRRFAYSDLPIYCTANPESCRAFELTMVGVMERETGRKACGFYEHETPLAVYLAGRTLER